MIRKRRAFFFVLLVFGLLASQTQAAMTIYGYSPNKHDRFYEGADRDFIGEGYDWSGVGVAWKEVVTSGVTTYNVKWITMISDQYFLTANHTNVAAADVGDVTFYEGNSLSGPSHTYTIDSIVATYGDLALGRLTEPINLADNIVYYPIFKFPIERTYKDFINLPFFAYGHGGSYPSATTEYDPRVGMNQIDNVINTTVDGVTTKSMTYDYDHSEGLGGDECLLRSGDSGAPSFVVYNGELALVGIHWFTLSDSSGSGDSFVPYYANSILSLADAEVASPFGGDANLDGTVDGDDATLMAANWQLSTGAVWAQGDFNGDKAVNDADAAIMAANWLHTASSFAVAATVVPEPAAIILLLSGLLITIGRAITNRRS